MVAPAFGAAAPEPIPLRTLRTALVVGLRPWRRNPRGPRMPAGNPDPADARCEPGPRRWPLGTRTPPMAPGNLVGHPCPLRPQAPLPRRALPARVARLQPLRSRPLRTPKPQGSVPVLLPRIEKAAARCGKCGARSAPPEVGAAATAHPRSAALRRTDSLPARRMSRLRRRRPRPGRPRVGPQLRVRSGIAPARDVSCETSSRPLNSRHLTSRPEPRPHPARDRRALPPPVSSATAANANSLAPRRMTKAAAAVGTPLHPPPAFHVKRNGVDPRVLCAAPRFNFPRALSAGKLMGVGRERRCHGGIRVCGASSARRNRAQSAHDEASCSIRHSGLRHGVGVRPVARGLKFSG